MTGSVLNRPLIRSVAIAAAIVGTIQAIIWVSLSLVSILIYYDVIIIDKNLVSFNYQNIIYDLFLNADNTNENVIVTSTVFNAFLYVYAISCFGWLVLSLYVLWAMKRNKWKGSSTFIGLWAGITILISVLDLVLIGLLADDYVTIQDLTGQSISSTTPITTPTETTTTTTSAYPSTPFPPEESSSTDGSTTDSSSSIYSSTTASAANSLSSIRYLFDALAYNVGVLEDGGEDQMLRQLINTSYIIVITLAARGYILWIINVVFACILLKFSITLSRAKTPSLLPMIDGYTTGRTPWNNLYEQTDIGNGFSNRGFTDDNEKSVFPRSDSFVTGEPDIIMNQNPLSNGTNPYAQQIERLRPVSDNPNIVSPKVAKIGKKNGRRTPPRNVPPPNIPPSNSPYIPDPDYTPPGSPLKPKSVLRPRSNYVL